MRSGRWKRENDDLLSWIPIFNLTAVTTFRQLDSSNGIWSVGGRVKGQRRNRESGKPIWGAKIRWLVAVGGAVYLPGDWLAGSSSSSRWLCSAALRGRRPLRRHLQWIFSCGGVDAHRREFIFQSRNIKIHKQKPRMKQRHLILLPIWLILTHINNILIYINVFKLSINATQETKASFTTWRFFSLHSVLFPPFQLKN